MVFKLRVHLGIYDYGITAMEVNYGIIWNP